jgi:hypothetical protein
MEFSCTETSEIFVLSMNGMEEGGQKSTKN